MEKCKVVRPGRVALIVLDNYTTLHLTLSAPAISSPSSAFRDLLVFIPEGQQEDLITQSTARYMILLLARPNQSIRSMRPGVDYICITGPY
jgi:hypothetical protein